MSKKDKGSEVAVNDQDPYVLSKRVGAVLASVVTILASLGVLDSVGLESEDLNNIVTAVSATIAAVLAAWSKANDNRPVKAVKNPLKTDG